MYDKDKDKELTGLSTDALGQLDLVLFFFF